MKRRRTVLIAVAIVVFAAVTYWLLHSTKEPEFENKALSEWLEELGSKASYEPSRAPEAVTTIGTNAIPLLLDYLSQTDSKFKQALIRLSYKLSLVRFSFRTADQRHQQAIRAFAILGTNASPAVPELARLLEEGRNAGAVAMSLGRIGTNALPVLVKALQSENAFVRVCAAANIGHLGGEAESAVPFLAGRLEDPEMGVAGYSAGTLAKIGSQAAIEALVAGLRNTNSLTRAWIAKALGNVGVGAVSAIPSLEQIASDDPMDWVRSEASQAIQSIAPGAAKPTTQPMIPE